MAWLKKCFVFVVMTSVHECTQQFGYPSSNHSQTQNASSKALSYPHVYSRRGISDASSAKDRIVFPGPTSDNYVYKEPKIPPTCQTDGICTEIPNFPTDYVDKIITEIEKSHKFTRDYMDIPDTPEISQRVGPQEDNIRLCNYREEIIYPQAGYDRNGDPTVIVNSPNNQVQAVKVIICSKEKSPCSNIVIFQDGYEGRCKQEFTQRQLWTLDNNGKAVETFVKVPSCCSCVGRQTI